MHKNNFYISFGVWLVVIYFLGISIRWVRILILLSGIFLILVSLGPTILKKLHVKPKQKRKPGEAEFENLSFQNDELKFSTPTEGQMEMDKHES